MNGARQVAKCPPQAPQLMNRQPSHQVVRNPSILIYSSHDRHVMAAGQRRFSTCEAAITHSVEDKAHTCGSERA